MISARAQLTSPARLLEGLSDKDRQSVLAEARQQNFREGAQLCREGEKASTLFLVTNGNAKLSRLTKAGKQVILYWLGPGDAFGLGTLLADPLPYLASAEAISRCEVSAWSYVVIRRLAQEYPQICSNALRIVLLYLSFQTERHSGLLDNNAKGRIAKTLVHLANRSGRVNPDGIDLDITNEQLASLADVSSFTVSRVLNEWQRKHDLTKRRNGLHIYAPEAIVLHAQ